MHDTYTRMPTGVEGLDDILHGGLIANHLYLVEGDPGAGKTTLALQFLLVGAQRGERVLYITLSETEAELVQVVRSHGWDDSLLRVLELVVDEDDLAGDAQLTMYQASEVELQETTKKMLSAVEAARPTRVVIDSLSEIRNLAQSTLRYRRQIMALKQFFAGRDCTVLLLDDCTGDGDDKQLQSIAHGVISLEHLAPVFGPARRKLRVLKIRGSAFREGFHDFRIQRGGLAVYPRLIASEHVEPFASSQIKSGITALDMLLGGGPDRGTSTLLVGPAGSGKSTIAIQYAIAAAQRGDHAVVYAFDESVATLEARTRGLGIDLAKGREAKAIRLQQVDPGELSPGEFSHLVRESVEMDGARVIVIDSLNGYLNSMPDEKLLATHMHEVLTYLGHRGVTTIMVVAQHGMVGANMMAPIDTSYLADSVVLLRFFEFEGTIRKAISVLKKRSGPHEDTIRELKFSSAGIHLSEPLRAFRGVLTGVPTLARPVEREASVQA